MRWIAAGVCILLAQSVTERFETAIKNFGERKYRITEKGKPVGLCTLKSRMAEEGRIRVALFEDRIETAGETPRIWDFIEKATVTGFILRSATRVDGGPREDDPKIIVEDGDAHVMSDQGNTLLKKVEGARGERALIRLICMAEQKVGTVLQTDLLVLDPVDYQRKQQVKCVAEESIDVAGRKTATFKWVDKREGNSVLSGEPIPYKFDNTYWVTTDGALVKFTAGALEMVLESK